MLCSQSGYLGRGIDLNILAFISSKAFINFWQLTLFSIMMNHALAEYLYIICMCFEIRLKMHLVSFRIVYNAPLQSQALCANSSIPNFSSHFTFTLSPMVRGQEAATPGMPGILLWWYCICHSVLWAWAMIRIYFQPSVHAIKTI